MSKNKKSRNKRQTIDDKVITEKDESEFKGGMGVWIGDACLRYNPDSKMYEQTSFKYNALNPEQKLCRYNEKCEYKLEENKEVYCGYTPKRKMK